MLVAAAFALLTTPQRVVIVSWDGAADWVIDRLLKEGALPNVARMAREGVSAEHMTQSFPSKTAVGHFTVFSGTWPRQSGVVNNSVPLLPRSEHTILETRSGFDAASHLTEPIWVTAAKAGKTAVALSAAGSYPPGPDQARLNALKVPLKRYVELSGFEANVSAAQVVPFPADREPGSLQLGETKVSYTPGRSSGEVTSVELAAEGTKVTAKVAKPGELVAWAGPLKVRKGALTGHVFFRLFPAENAGGTPLLYVRAANGMQGTESAAANQAYMDAYGGFHDEPWGVYQRGALGKPVYAGGSGVAEERLLEILALDQEFLKRSFRFGLKRYPGQLYFHYTPNSDSAGHTWMGALDRDSGVYSPEIAAKVWPYYRRVFQLQDEWLGDMMAAAGPNTAFILVSDHGMAGISRYFNVNYALSQAGLCAFDADGRLDLAKTKVCAPPWGDNQLVVNSTDWKGGIVSASEREQVLAEAEKVLLSARDPQSGRPIVTRVFWPDQAPEVGIGGPAGGDLYFDLAPSYYPSNRRATGLISPGDEPIGNGVHGFWPLRRDMHAIFYMVGPGVARGVQIPAMRSVDVVPTLCRLMGMPASSDVVGQVLGGALRR